VHRFFIGVNILNAPRMLAGLASFVI